MTTISNEEKVEMMISMFTNEKRKLEIENIKPYIHLGIIPDGNRRWCKKNNKDKFEYAAMARNMIQQLLDDICLKKVYSSFSLVSELSIYILSKDNLQRNDNTIDLIRKTLDFCKTLFSLPKYGEMFSLTIHGNCELLSPDIQEIINESKSFATGTFPIHLAIAYDPLEDSQLFFQEMNNGNPRNQIDLIIRSGGQYRSSGFFPLQTLYSEWIYLDDLWPDITQEHLDHSIREFLTRKRNFGK